MTMKTAHVSSTSIDAQIKHYKAIIKNETGNRAHYAMGALDILARVKTLRDQLRQEMRDTYRDRGGAGGGSYWYTKDFCHSLENAMREDI